MMKLIVLLLFALSLNLAFGQASSEIHIIQHINSLSTDSMKYRPAGSRGERNANKYIRENWGDGKRASFYSWEYKINNGTDSLTSEMVGCFLRNKAKATILIGAPLENSRDVAAFLGLQNELALLKLDVNVMLVAVTGNDNGHQGLEYLATHMPKSARDIRLVINLNGIGNLDKIKPELSITATAGIFQELQTLIKQFDLIEEDSSLLAQSSIQNYYTKGIQCLSLSTNPENELNTNGILQTQEFLIQWIKTK